MLIHARLRTGGANTGGEDWGRGGGGASEGKGQHQRDCRSRSMLAPRKVRPVQQAGRASGSLSHKSTLLCWEVSRRSVLSPGAGPGNPV